MAIEIGQAEWELYVPECERETYKRNPEHAMTVEVRHPKYCMRDLRTLSTDREVGESDEDYSCRKFCQYVRNVRNFRFEGREVTQAEDFFWCAPIELITEISEEVYKFVTPKADTLGNSGSPSDSPSLEEMSEGGDAPSVTPQLVEDAKGMWSLQTQR